MQSVKPIHILVTNDDSITAPGLYYLIRAAVQIGKVTVIAPDIPQSGKSHSITTYTPLRLTKINLYPEYDITAYKCSGTPIDCVKLAFLEVCKENLIDLVLSGVNHGNNTSLHTIYSGTMGAAIESAIRNIPAIGYSLDDETINPDFTHTEPYIIQIAKKVLENKTLYEHIALNVNFPKRKEEKIKGFKICRQAPMQLKEYLCKKEDQFKKNYYWIDQKVYLRKDHEEQDDIWAIKNNYISIVPCQFDLTAHEKISTIEKEFGTQF